MHQPYPGESLLSSWAFCYSIFGLYLLKERWPLSFTGIQTVFTKFSNPGHRPTTKKTKKKLQVYNHLPPILQIIQVRRAKYAGYCWGSKEKLISKVILRTPTHEHISVSRPAKTNVYQSVLWGYWLPSRELMMSDRQQKLNEITNISIYKFPFLNYER